MKGLLGTIILATCLAACTADCQSGLNGQEDGYECKGLKSLKDLSVPVGASHIVIDGGSIDKITTGSFTKYGDSLVRLNISRCGVETIERDAFKRLYKLEMLALPNNKIRKIDASWISGLPNLKELIMWGNRIVEIDANIYDILLELEVLDISDNQLTACLEANTLQKLEKLRKIFLGYNPWSYRCRFLMTWYLDSNRIRSIRDWSDLSDMSIEDCLAHEAGAEQNDNILIDCVDQKVASMRPMVFSADISNDEVGKGGSEQS